MSKTRVCKSVSTYFSSLVTAGGLACALLLSSGCGVTLEDGYKPRSLDANSDTRKSYYASPFTEDADPSSKEPGGGGGGGAHGGGR